MDSNRDFIEWATGRGLDRQERAWFLSYVFEKGYAGPRAGRETWERLLAKWPGRQVRRASA